MPAGLSSQKRSWDGSGSTGSTNGHPPKRPKDEGARDWKDVYLNGDSRNGGRREGDRNRDRYKSRERERDRDVHRSDSRRDAPRHRGRDQYRDDRYRSDRKVHGNGRPSGRPDRDEKDRSRHLSRHRPSPGPHRSRSPKRGRSHSKITRDHQKEARVHSSEREEGELSPAASRSVTRSPSASTRVSQKASPPPPALMPEKTDQPALEIELEEAAPKPVEETLAERRARRQAIRAKYAGTASAALSMNETASPSPGLSSAVSQPPPTTSEANIEHKNYRPDLIAGASEKLDGSVVVSRRASPQPMSPAIESFDLIKEDKPSDTAVQVTDGTGEQISAADYDPSFDRREDEEKRVRAVTAKDEKHQDTEMIEVEEEEEEDDVDDMFALDTVEKKKTKKVRKIAKPAAPALVTTTLDTAADAEGYYQVILGEQLDSGKYQVFSSLGKGMFANVVRARILSGDASEVGKEVAIKIVRAQESMYKAGLKEAQILAKLRQADPDDKKHIVRLERTFEHRGHLCLVFESLSMNLRDVVKRFGKDVGLNIRAVRAYAHQLFLAMSLLRKCNVMHADIKPDNILANEQKTVLKVCDLGSASDVSENEITPYLVSRFYRAPEIILGVPYDCALDIWSIGCTLYELYTGKILFPGRSNNQMLLLMMELKGRFNSKMIKKAKFGEDYFDEMGAFQSAERDKVTGADIIRKVHIAKPTRDLRARLLSSSSRINDEEDKLILSFIDLLDKCLMLDPSRRITPKEALVHPFIRG